MKPAIVKLLATVLGIFWLASTFAAETIPPKPSKYFNDFAGVVSSGTAAQLNAQLEQFERDSYNQIVVAIYPKMQSDDDMAAYCVRVANTWQVGQKDKRNGAVLFVFTQDRKMFIATGYGLEGALPDATCKDIIEDVIKPQFKASNFDAGLVAGVDAILAATKGEYHGTGHTVRENDMSRKQPGVAVFIFFIVVFILIAIVVARSNHSGAFYSNAGWVIGNVIGNMGSRGGGSWGGGGGGGGGGGFSSGGGSFGGGGAGGSW